MPHEDRQWTRRAFLGGMAVGGGAALIGLSPRRAHAAPFTLVDSESVPGPADSMAVLERGHRTIVISLAFNTNEAVSYRVEDNSTLTLVGRTPTGPGPRAVAAARNGNYAVIVNSASDDMSVMSISDGGVLAEVRRVPSGGDNPFDVAAAFDDLVVVANRDSDSVALFSIDRRGNMRQLGSHSAGIDPHVIAIGPQGAVAVANSTSNDLSIFDLERDGNMSLVDQAFPVGNSPRAVAFGSHGYDLFVATRSTQFGVVEDQIQTYDVGESGELQPAGSTDGGLFLTDLEARHGVLFAATANAAGQNQVRAYRRRRTDLAPIATLETPGAPPSFKQLATARGKGDVDWRVFVSEFQAGLLRSIEYRAP